MNNIFFFSRSMLLILLLGLTATTAGEDIRFRLSTGVDYTRGDYGADEDIEDLYVPVSASFDRGRVGFRLTVPYLRVRAPVGTIVTDPGQVVVGAGPKTTESGVGDIIGSITLYDIVDSRRLSLAMDVSAKVKFGTADEDKGLGTGEEDYSLQANFYKFFDQFYLSATAGYKLRGDPSDLDLENVWFTSLGGNYHFTAQTRGGIFYDYRQSAFDEGESVRELSGFVSLKLSESWRAQLYGLAGLSDGSPDWGTGMLLTYYF